MQYNLFRLNMQHQAYVKLAAGNAGLVKQQHPKSTAAVRNQNARDGKKMTSLRTELTMLHITKEGWKL